jgi:uncharacterized hydrophobic protein (TIGR00341 family)
MKFLKVTFPNSYKDRIIARVEQSKAVDWSLDTGYGRYENAMDIVIAGKHGQSLVDDLQAEFSGCLDWRINVMTLEASLPVIEAPEPEKEAGEGKGEDENKEKSKNGALREELVQKVTQDTEFDVNFIVLTILSAIVATIGLNSDSVTIVIAAMVIAPLLGPILAFALGTALGDTKLMMRAAKTGLLGFAIGFLTALLMTIVVDVNLTSQELMDRTTIGPAIVVLALASGAAAALSLTTGLSSALVGVMVAVALLPPSAASALYFGAGDYGAAQKAAILLGLNVVSVLLAAQLVFAWKGVRPRIWYDQGRALKAMRINIVLWTLTLAGLLFLGSRLV